MEKSPASYSLRFANLKVLLIDDDVNQAGEIECQRKGEAKNKIMIIIVALKSKHDSNNKQDGDDKDINMKNNNSIVYLITTCVIQMIK